MLPQVPRKLFVNGVIAPAEIPKRKKRRRPDVGRRRFVYCLGKVTLFVFVNGRRSLVEDAGIARPIVAPVARMNDGIVGHAWIGFAGVTWRKVVGSRVARRNVIRMVRRQSRPDVNRRR